MDEFCWEDRIERISLDIFGASSLDYLLGCIDDAKDLRGYFLLSSDEGWAKADRLIRYLDSEMAAALKPRRSWSETTPVDLGGVIAWDDTRVLIGESYYDCEVISREQCDANAQ